jgi:hypothetical protein
VPGSRPERFNEAALSGRRGSTKPAAPPKRPNQTGLPDREAQQDSVTAEEAQRDQIHDRRGKAQRFRVTAEEAQSDPFAAGRTHGAGFTTGEIQRGRTLRPKRLNETRVTAEEAQRDQIHDRRGKAQRLRVTAEVAQSDPFAAGRTHGAGFTTEEIQRGRTLRPKRLNETRGTAEEAQRDQIHDRGSAQDRV